MILQLPGIVNIVYFLSAVRFWLFNFVLFVLLFLLFHQIYRLFSFVFLILVLNLGENNRSRLFLNFFKIQLLLFHYYFAHDIRGSLLQFLVCVLHMIKHFNFPTYIFYLNLLVVGIQFLMEKKLFLVLK